MGLASSWHLGKLSCPIYILQLTGGPHGKHSGSWGLGHDCRDLPCLQPNLFKLELTFRECLGEVLGVVGGEGKQTHVRGLNGNRFIMFIDWYPGIVSAISGCSLKNLLRQILGVGLAPLLQE